MIDRLYVHNFRCLENFTLNLSGTPSALLIGRNGAGKSTVVKCLQLIQSICRGVGRSRELISESDFSYGRTDHPMRFDVEVTLSQRRFRYAIAFEWPPKFREARILEESLQVDGEPVFSRRQSQVELQAGARFGLDWHVFAISLIEGRTEIDDFKSLFARTVLISPIPKLMSGFSEEPSIELQEDASNFASAFRALLTQKPAAYGKFESYVKESIPDFSSIENKERGEKGHQLFVLFETKDPVRSLRVAFNSLSDGEKCFFLSAYILAANAVGAPVVCVWDEPDNHLSLSQVGYFVTDLRRMTNRGGQFLATSHHPETIRKFPSDATLVLSRKSHLDPSVPRPLSDYEYDGDLVNALIRDEVIG